MDWRNDIGLPLKHFIKDKYGSQKECCKRLRIKESNLSMVIAGKRKLSYRYQEKFVKDGFDVSIFYNYLSLPTSENYEGIEDIKYIVGQLKEIIRTKDLLLDAANMQIANLEYTITEKNQQIKELKKHNLVNSQKLSVA
jgi:hypothetical protein